MYIMDVWKESPKNEYTVDIKILKRYAVRNNSSKELCAAELRGGRRLQDFCPSWIKGIRLTPGECYRIKAIFDRMVSLNYPSYYALVGVLPKR